MAAPTFEDALDTGIWYGTATTALLVLGVGSVVLGLRVLRRGRAALERSILLVVYGSCAVAALTQGMWLLGALTLAALVLLTAVAHRGSAAA